MRGRHDARVWRRRGALTSLALLILGGPRRVGAQADVPLGVRREPDPSSASPLRAVADVSLCRALDCERTVSADLEVAPAARWRVTAEGTAGRSVVQPTSRVSADARFDLFYGDATRRIWIGRGAAQPREIDSPGSGLSHWIEYGAAARWRSVSVSVDLSAGSQSFVFATASVTALAERGAADAEFADLRSHVEREIGRGSPPDAATRARTAVLLRDSPGDQRRQAAPSPVDSRPHP